MLGVGLGAERGHRYSKEPYRGEGLAQAFEDLDSAGFAGAVGAEEAEDFTGFYFEIDTADGGDFSVALVEGFHEYGALRIHRGRLSGKE